MHSAPDGVDTVAAQQSVEDAEASELEARSHLAAAEEVSDADNVEWEPPDYGSDAFWEQHFASAPHGSAADPAALEYEWICADLERLVNLLVPYLPSSGLLFHPGCGMSQLPLKLHDLGLEVLSVDSSPSCVTAMSEAYGKCRRLCWEVRDARDLGDISCSAPFAGAVEKGCLDAMLCDSEASGSRYIAELARVLPAGCPLLLVSNSPVRHRHLTPLFVVREVLSISPEDPFGSSLFVCERAASEL
mmetsp:Transcript_129084/g.210384  ORF Transcript_129084/g.210384 Transcript_129084/m.210384 type:complete len:246 (-) Transcript_129084:9-746(-)